MVAMVGMAEGEDIIETVSRAETEEGAGRTMNKTEDDATVMLVVAGDAGLGFGAVAAGIIGATATASLCSTAAVGASVELLDSLRANGRPGTTHDATSWPDACGGGKARNR
jgi:hypothetical protein